MIDISHVPSVIQSSEFDEWKKKIMSVILTLNAIRSVCLPRSHLRHVLKINRTLVRLRHARVSLGLGSFDTSILSPAGFLDVKTPSISARSIVQKARTNDETHDLSMEDELFADYVRYLVENKTLIPRYHNMLTSKLGDHDLR